MKKKYIALTITGLLLVFCVSGIYYRFHNSSLKKKQTQIVSVKILKTKFAEITNHTTTTGLLRASQQTNITPEISGYVQKIYYHEGDYVQKGSLLLALDNRKAKDALVAAQADAALSRLTYQRDTLLFKQHYVAKQNLDKARDQYIKDNATVNADKTTLAETVLRAPFSGYIGSRNISVGDYVQAGQAITTLTNTNNLRVDYALPDRYSNLLHLDQTVAITTDNMPTQQFAAKVIYISPTINSDAQTIEIHATLSNNKQLLKPGEFVKVNQQLSKPQRVMIIPATSVFTTLTGDYVFTVENNEAIKTSILISKHLTNNRVIVTKGLKANELVVVAGQQNLKNGLKVEIIK